MNSKYYVSLEAARLLKEKGYDRECMAYYQNDEFHPYAFSRYELSINDKNAAPSYMNQYSAPAKDEAIDWLDSKGIVIEVFSVRIGENRKWCYSIINAEIYITIETPYKFSTRLEAEDAAIIRACELLKGKEE